jgi:hypothetical protein
MLNIQQFEDSRSIVGDSGILVGSDHLVHASGTYLVAHHTESRLDDIHNGLDGVDVRDDLADSLHGISAVSEEQDGGLLGKGGGTKRCDIYLKRFKFDYGPSRYNHTRIGQRGGTG